MVFSHEGYLYGAWTVTLDSKSRCFPSDGRGFPGLDELYEPLVANPTHWSDYSTALKDGAIEELIRTLK